MGKFCAVAATTLTPPPLPWRWERGVCPPRSRSTRPTSPSQCSQGEGVGGEGQRDDIDCSPAFRMNPPCALLLSAGVNERSQPLQNDRLVTRRQTMGRDHQPAPLDEDGDPRLPRQ